MRAYLPVTPPVEHSKIEACLRLTLPKRSTNPGEFDLSEYLARQGICLVGSAKTDSLVKVGPPDFPSPAAGYLRSLRGAILRDCGEEGGTVLALLLGERGLMGTVEEDTLSRSGLYHLVALSGFNVGLVLLVLVSAAHLFGLHPLKRDLVCLVALLAYGAVVVERPSFTRALLMAGLFLVARIAARPHAATRSWCLSVALILGLSPGLILDTGFQLTFLATLGIISLYGAYPQFLPQAGPAGWCFRLLWVGASAQLATLPVLVIQFQRLSLLGWLATPLASLPLLSVQALGIVYMAGAFSVPWLSGLLGAGMSWSAHLFLVLPETLGSWKFGTLFLVQPSVVWVSLFASAMLLAALGGKLGRAGWVLACLACTGAWSSPRILERAPATSLVMLDVGQASCQLALWGRRALLVDAGNGVYRGPTSGRGVIEPFLASAGVRALDGVIVTHWDEDHAGSLVDILRDVPTGFVSCPEIGDAERSSKVLKFCLGLKGAPPLIELHRGQCMDLGGCTVDVWNPPAGSEAGEENDRSLSLLLTVAGKKLLFTGDISRKAETEMIRGGVTKMVDLVVAPHHGSGGSNSTAFLEAISPGICLISAGRGNRFHHPAAAALERYRKANSRICRTDTDGAILVRLDGTGLGVWKMCDGNWEVELRPRCRG